jgi:single-stranded-DNA-specific exonuclease
VTAANLDGSADLLLTPMPLNEPLDVSEDVPSPNVAAFLNQLYESSSSYLERDRYSTIGEADAFFTKLVGVTFDGRQDIVGGMVVDTAVDLRRDSSNAFDANAIGVWYGSLQIGFIRKEIARLATARSS